MIILHRKGDVLLCSNFMHRKPNLLLNSISNNALTSQRFRIAIDLVLTLRLYIIF